MGTQNNTIFKDLLQRKKHEKYSEMQAYNQIQIREQIRFNMRKGNKTSLCSVGSTACRQVAGRSKAIVGSCEQEEASEFLLSLARRDVHISVS